MQLRPSDAINLAGQADEQVGRRHLSHSSIALLLACPRKFELHYHAKLELIERNRPLSLGKCFQLAIEHQDPEVGVRALRGETPCDFCSGTGHLGLSRDFDTGALEVNEACENCDGEGWIKTAGGRQSLTPEQQDRLMVDKAIIEGASKLYLKTWPGGAGETREFEYRVRLRNPWTGAYSRTFDLLGKADGLQDEHGRPGCCAHIPSELVAKYGCATCHGPHLDPWSPLGLIENKLVGSISPQKVQRLPLDRQVALARYGIWRATGRKVETVRYRWVRKPQIRQKIGESIEEYCERIRQDYEARPDFYMHEEEPQFATTGDLLRVEAELWILAEQVRHSERQKLYVRNTAHCSDFGGCQYIPICTGDPDAMSLYRTRESTPEPQEAITA